MSTPNNRKDSGFIELHFAEDSPISLQRCSILAVQPFTDKPSGEWKKKSRVIIGSFGAGKYVDVVETYDEIMNFLEERV